MSKEIIPIERVVQSIRWFRDQKVLLDSDLAALYGVTTGNLNRRSAGIETDSHQILCSDLAPRRRKI
jgi:ORF6N domain